MQTFLKVRPLILRNRQTVSSKYLGILCSVNQYGYIWVKHILSVHNKHKIYRQKNTHPYKDTHIIPQSAPFLQNKWQPSQWQKTLLLLGRLFKLVDDTEKQHLKSTHLSRVPHSHQKHHLGSQLHHHTCIDCRCICWKPHNGNVSHHTHC